MYRILIQNATDKALFPKQALLRQWAKAALSTQIKSAELTLRIVGVAEMSELNLTYRHKQGPTNVLSFPFDVPPDIDLDPIILGDIVICADVVAKEAKEQHKQWEAHWAHMVVHGVFHLLGYDHEKDEDADIMETLEVKTMLNLNFPNPYEIGEHIKHYGR